MWSSEVEVCQHCMAWVPINHHGVLTRAADSTCQPCASSDVYGSPKGQQRQEELSLIPERPSQTRLLFSLSILDSLFHCDHFSC